MYDFLDKYVYFISHITFKEFFLMFWFYFLFEFMKYMLIDIWVVIKFKLKEKRVRKLEDEARIKLFRDYPLISVIVPGKNEGPNIHKLSLSLSEQTYNNYELIIVDDGSDDDTALICKDLLKKGIIDKFISNPDRGGKASAANTALKFTKGKLIVHLDADSHLAKNSIETILLPFYMYDNVGAVGGDVRVNNIEKSLATRLQGIEYLKSISMGRFVASELDMMRLISGAYGAFRADVLERLGGWDVGPGLDGDITLKIRKLGYKVLFNIESVCYTNAPFKFKVLAKQRFRWDRSIVRFRLRKHLNILFNSNFEWSLRLSIFDNIFYNFAFDFFWFLYLVNIIFFYTDLLAFAFISNYLLYVTMNYVKFFLIIFFIGHTFRKKDFSLLLYIPAIPIYTGIFLRLVRIYAHVMELLFKVSYYDRWNPWKVSKVVKEKGI